MCFRLVYSWFLVFFFFSSRRRHTRCALVTGVQTCALPISRNPALEPVQPHDLIAHADRRRDQSHPVAACRRGPYLDVEGEAATVRDGVCAQPFHRGERSLAIADRKSAGEGKSVEGRVETGGGRDIKKKNNNKKPTKNH